MDKKKIKAILALKGYTVRSFCETFGVDYQTLLRKINLGVLKVSDIDFMAKNLGLSPGEVCEFFLPLTFENLKQNAN